MANHDIPLSGRPRAFRKAETPRTGETRDSLLRAALDQAPAGLIVLDSALNTRLVTRSAADLLGLPAGAGGARTALPVLLAQSPFLDDTVLRTLSAVFSRVRGEHARETIVSVPCPTGPRIVSVLVHPVAVRGTERGWVASLTDVTETREQQEWLLEHAATDPVTGLWNRQHFMLMLRDRLEEASESLLGVVLIDLTRSRSVGTIFGTPLGDTLLRLIGQRLAGLLRDSDLLARFTSDEFAVLLPDLPERAAVGALMDRISLALCRPFKVDGHEICVSMHAGAACAPDDGDTPESLLAHAGLALSAARMEARGLLRFYEPTLEAQAEQRRALESDLRAALGRGEFELHYQPQIDLHTRRVAGVEALLRWRHPRRGVVPPSEFIALAEELDLIGDIGNWVLKTACRAATRWPGHITVAVNVSPLQVEAGNFETHAEAALKESGLAGARLEIEITENLLLRDNGIVLGTFDALRALGVRLVLDDFGTGYASLSQLGRFQFDKIKIDRSFVAVTPQTGGRDAILRSIAGLGVSLGVATTAEGVETEQQLQRVAANGCTNVQGFYFARPVPERDIVSLIASFEDAASAGAGAPAAAA